MTITTAKLPRKALRLTPLALAALLLSAECHADLKLTPTIGIAETYSDNPGLQRSGDAHGQWISEATPGFVLSSRSRRVRLNASGEWRFYHYQDQNTPNVHDRERRYSASLGADLIEELLTLDANASGSRQAISAFGPRYSDGYSTFNRTDVQTWSVSPILRHRFGHTADLLMRVTRDSVQSDGANTASAFGDSKGTTGLVALNSPSNAADALGWGLQYQRQKLDTDLFGSSTSVNASGNLRYRLSRTLSAVGTVGHDSYEYTSINNRTSGASYSGGVVWTPSNRTSIDARIGHSFLGRTGSLMAVQRSRHVVSQVMYADQVTTTRAQFLLPVAIDTATLVDRMFLTAIPDPIARARTVENYIAATGLPPTMASTVNYLSNRYMRDKRLQAAFIYNMSHSSLTLDAYRSQRTALSVGETDSKLLGNQLLLNDNVRQVGIDASLNYRLSSRTTATAVASANRSTSLTTGIMTPGHFLNLGLTRKFGRHTQASVEFRHFHYGAGVLSTGTSTGGGYSENALRAALSVQL